MLIHHEDMTRLGIEIVVRVVVGKTGKLYLLYKSPKAGAKGIVELSQVETNKIFTALTQERVDDESIWRIF